MKLSDAAAQERALEADKAYARQHARAYCNASSRYFMHADEYADWFIARYWHNDAGIEALPGHPNVWPLWRNDLNAGLS